MQVRCIKLSGIRLKITVPSSGKTIESTPKLDQFLEIGKVYTVYGVSVWRNGLNYLLDIPLDGKTCPEWFHVEYFEIVDSLLPNNMHFRYFGESDKRGVNALWGYPELIYDYDHYAGLIEMEKSALAIFAKRKQEIDQQMP